jgi:hypothetical protein
MPVSKVILLRAKNVLVAVCKMRIAHTKYYERSIKWNPALPLTEQEREEETEEEEY